MVVCEWCAVCNANNKGLTPIVNIRRRGGRIGAASNDRPSTLPPRFRGEVLPGNMLYSAVTQPLPLPNSQGGTFSSTLAVQSTVVRPALTCTRPGAAPGTFRSIWKGLSELDVELTT